jgi:hypothetical protein
MPATTCGSTIQAMEMIHWLLFGIVALGIVAALLGLLAGF